MEIQNPMSKRLCTGLGNEPRSTAIHWAGPQDSSEGPFHLSRYDSQNPNVRGYFSSATVSNDVSPQHVGSVTSVGDVLGQTPFQSDQHLPWPSSDHNLHPLWLEVANNTYSANHGDPDAQTQPVLTSYAYDSRDPPSSANTFDPNTSPASNILYGGDFHDEYTQSDVGTIARHGCHQYVADGASEPQEVVDIEHGHTTYEHCLGLIDTATLRVSSATLENIPEGHSVVNLEINGSVTIVHSVYKQNNSDYMGLLDGASARVLAQIHQKYDVHIGAYIRHDRKFDSKTSGTTWGATIPIHMVVYGQPDDSELIGQALSENNIFLQHPQHIEPGALYRNPQYFICPGEDYPSIECTDAGLSSSWTEPSNESGTLKEILLDSIFESAQGPQTYSIIEPSSRLSTTLQPHQQMGLAMMHEKESGNLQKNEFTSMWIQTRTLNGRTWYRNSVTGSVTEDPMLCLGGLLADEMGLGKSLTIIALIASTLDAMATLSSEECPCSPFIQAGKCNRTTLIVTPKSTLHSWREQFDRHTDRIIVCYFYTTKKKMTLSALLDNDVIVTTYGMLTAERKRRAKHSSDEDQPLLANHWLRVVLDEAHVIRNASTQQCATVCALKARHRWCLTGTPIQNRVEDFGSLLQFLQVYPFNDPASFTHEIADWIRCGDQKGMNRLRLLVSAVCLRRTKSCLGLPPRQNENYPVVFNSEEKHLYETCKQSTVEFIDLVFKEDGRLKSFATVIQLILQLRQICNHGKELLSNKTLKSIEDFRLSQGSMGEKASFVETALCGICCRKSQDVESLLPCMHPACSSCFEDKEMMISKGELECSSCADMGSPKSNNGPAVDQDQSMPFARSVDYKPSSKVAALMENLLSYNEGSTDTPIKSVVFSYWTKMLDLISQALNIHNIGFERLDGKMTVSKRHKAINKFRSDPRCTVFLATVGSAGVGIDLTAACRVHLMEPQWNPMAEEQALDRVHRIGQTQPVIATRYVVSESVEEYVVSLQKKKLDLIQQSFEPNAAAKTSALKERLKTLHQFLASSSPSAAGK